MVSHSLLSFTYCGFIFVCPAPIWEAGPAPRILRWVYEERIRERKKMCTPTFPNVGGTSKQIPAGACWIYWNLLSGCHINKHRPAYGIMNHGTVLAAICHTLYLYSARSNLACTIDLNNAAVQWGWTMETRPKPSFQISLTWQVSTRVRGVEIQSLVQYWIKTAVEAKIIFIGPPPVPSEAYLEVRR